MTSPDDLPGSRPRSFDEWVQAFKEQASFFTGLKLTDGGAPRWQLADVLPVLPVVGAGVGLWTVSSLIETLRAGEFPNEHRAQCQGALWIAERQWLDLIVYYSKMPMFVRRVHRDEGYIATLAGAVKEFNEELAQMVAWLRRYGTEARAA